MWSKKSFLWMWFAILCILLLLFVLKIDFRDLEGLKDTLGLLGKWAPGAFLLLCSIRSFLLLPCGLFSTAAGAFFGPVWGGILALTGFTLNAALMYYTADALGQNWAKRHFANKVEALDHFVNQNSFTGILFLRMISLLPFDAVSCIGGITKTKMDSFVLATLAGSIPGVFIYTYFGFSIKTMSLQKIILAGCFLGIFTIIPFLYKLYMYKKKSKEDKIKAI